MDTVINEMIPTSNAITSKNSIKTFKINLRRPKPTVNSYDGGGLRLKSFPATSPKKDVNV